VVPSDATYSQLTWSSDDPSIASVSSNGLIKALACGETTIKATSKNNISSSIKVKVIEVKAESINISGPQSILLGETASLTAKLLPVNTTDKNIVWSIDNTTIASIDEQGNLITHDVGIVIVTAIQKDVSASLTIEILPVKVDGIIIRSNTEGKIIKGDTIDFYADVSPYNAKFPDVTWSVSNPKVASIDEDGTLVALKLGTTIIKATSADGFSAEYEITVSASTSDTVIVIFIIGVGIVVVSIIVKKRRQKTN
jgi:uncharacterized protein YjdB